MYQDELRDEAVGGMVDEELPQPELVTSQQLELMTTQPEFVTPSMAANVSMSATASMPNTSCSKSTSCKRRQSDFDVQYRMESLQQLIKSHTEKQKAATPDDE